MSSTSGSPVISRDTTPTNSPNHTVDGVARSSTTNQVMQEEPLPDILKIGKSKGADVLTKYYQENHEGMYFSDFNEAFAAIKQAEWQPPANDATIPRDQEQDRAIIRRLVEAFLDLSSAMDTEGNAYRKRFTPGTTVYYNPWTIERCAWEILHMVKAIHLDGFKAPIFDTDILKCVGQTELWTFEERISMICRVVKISKSVAVSLMKHEKVWTTIGAPHKLYNSTLVNTQSNAYRNKWVKAGREADKANSEQPGGKRKRGSLGNTSRKTSATIVPSPLATTFATQSDAPFTTSAFTGGNFGDTGVRVSPSPAPASLATTSATQTILPQTTPAAPSNNAGDDDAQPSFAPAPLPPMLHPQPASHNASSIPPSNTISDGVTGPSSTPAPLATIFPSHSASPYAAPAPLRNGTRDVNALPSSTSAPVAALASSPAPAPAPFDNDVEMTDAAPEYPTQADNKENETNSVDTPSIKVTTEPKANPEVVSEISRFTALDVKPAKPQVPEPVPADTVTTLSSATAAAVNPRSAAEFDAAEMLLGLRKTEG